MQLAEKHAVRYMHVCTCTNVPDPFHMCLWEGVPLRGPAFALISVLGIMLLTATVRVRG